jgi:hypothetical protein
MIRWEYCQLEPDKARRARSNYQGYQAFYSSQERADNVESGQERNVFVSWRDALNYLGDAGWEALHVDADGFWYFKRRYTHEDTNEN